MSMRGRHTVIQVLIHVILIAAAVYTLAPLALLLFNSFKPNNDIIESPVALPASWSFEYIMKAAEQINFFKAIGITFIITVVSIFLLVVVSSLAAWVMVRSKSLLGKIMYLGFAAAMLIPFQSLISIAGYF